MQKYVLIASIILLTSLLFWLLFGWQPAGEQILRQGLPTHAEQPSGGDFTLQSYQGPVSLADFRGRLVMLYFGYTWCPDICPTNLALFSRVLNELSPQELSQVQPIFISVDPSRDTPQRLREYTTYFHEKLIGITGTPEEVARTAALYGVAYRAVNPDTETNYAVDHSADTYIIDRDGRLVQRLPHGTSVEVMLTAIHSLLKPTETN